MNRWQDDTEFTWRYARVLIGHRPDKLIAGHLGQLGTSHLVGR